MGRGIEKKANVDCPKEYYLKTQKDLYKDMDGNLTKEGLKKKMKQEQKMCKSSLHKNKVEQGITGWRNGQDFSYLQFAGTESE